MTFGIYDPPDSSIKPWPSLHVGTIVNVTEFEYDKKFCGVGNFEVYVPLGSVDVDKLKKGRFLFCTDGYFIIKQTVYGADSLIVSGYDLNGLLLDRLTVAKTEDGKDKISGSTEYIVKHFVEVNCTTAADSGRAFPGLSVATNKNRGLAKDAASPRLEIVANVISDILSAQQMGWRINAVNLALANTNKLFEFEVYESVKRTVGTARPKTFSYGFGNADSIKTENSIANAKNTLYCELDDGTVQTYSPIGNNVGFNRTEEYADLGCELSEISIYARHEIAGRYAAVENVTLEHVDASGFGEDTPEGFNLGDIVTVVDNNANVQREALISSVKIKRTGENALDLSTEESEADVSSGKNAHSLSITVGGSRVKPLDRVAKAAEAVESAVKSLKGDIKAIGVNDRARYVQTYDTPVSKYYDIQGPSFLRTMENGIGYEVGLKSNARTRPMMSSKMSYGLATNSAFAVNSISYNFLLNPSDFVQSDGTQDFIDFSMRAEALKPGISASVDLSLYGHWITGNMFEPSQQVLVSIDYYDNKSRIVQDFSIAGVTFSAQDDGLHITRENSLVNKPGTREALIPWNVTGGTSATAQTETYTTAQNSVQPAKGGAEWTYEEDGIHINYNGHTKVIPWDK